MLTESNEGRYSCLVLDLRVFHPKHILSYKFFKDTHYTVNKFLFISTSLRFYHDWVFKSVECFISVCAWVELYGSLLHLVNMVN